MRTLQQGLGINIIMMIITIVLMMTSTWTMTNGDDDDSDGDDDHLSIIDPNLGVAKPISVNIAQISNMAHL